jgi:hypothetical protein
VVGHNKVPKKILKDFPLIPKLKIMFQVLNLSELMRWHRVNISHDGLVRHAPDSKAHAHIDETWPDFATDLQNLRLVATLNGVNPFSNQSKTGLHGQYLFSTTTYLHGSPQKKKFLCWSY